MPYTIRVREGKHCVVKKSDGKVVACHETRQGAVDQIAAISASESRKFERVAKVSTINKRLGIVFGWAVESVRKGERYFDTQGDHYAEEAMVADFADFMLKSRTSGEMHEAADGDVVFLFPLTSELAKAFEIKTERTGVMVGIKPSPEVLAKFESGEYTGFSIGGQRLDEEVVEW